MNEQGIKDAIQEYINRKTEEHIKVILIESQEKLRKAIEKEALEIALHVAQMYRIDHRDECITISVIKRF